MACTNYGAGPDGFTRKPFTEILDELKASAVAANDQANAAAIANGAPGPFYALDVTDDLSPQGQMIGVFADAIDDLWQQLQGNADNCDMSKAEGCQLDKLAPLRGTSRNGDESDADFRARLLGQNATGAAGNTVLDNLITSVYAEAGVTCVSVNVNDTGNTNGDGLPPHSYEVVVDGSYDEAAVAAVIWAQHPAGITLYGNIEADVPTQLDCQTISFSRPTAVPICAEVKLRAISDGCGCAEGDIAILQQALRDHFGGDCPDCRFGVGDDVIYNSLFEPFYANFTGFIVQSLRIKRADATEWTTENISIAGNERPVLSFGSDCTSIEFV